MGEGHRQDVDYLAQGGAAAVPPPGCHAGAGAAAGAGAPGGVHTGAAGAGAAAAGGAHAGAVAAGAAAAGGAHAGAAGCATGAGGTAVAPDAAGVLPGMLPLMSLTLNTLLYCGLSFCGPIVAMKGML